MKLHKLTPALTGPVTIPAGSRDLEINSLHYRAQEVGPGGLFVAIAGQVADGHDYIARAVEQGAVAVVAERPVDCPVPLIQVADSRAALGRLAACFYDEPSRKMTIIGVTGTSGKTTVTYLLEQILEQAGFRPGVIGSINRRWGGETLSSPINTPESLDLQEILAAMADNGVTHVVMEVSSHSVALKRIAACYLDVAVFTNLSQDHLDFHGNMADYWAVKKRLFTHHLATGPKAPRAVAVVNAQNRYGRELGQALPGNLLTSGSDAQCDIRVSCDRQDLNGLKGHLRTPRGRVPFRSSLVGGFNIENIANAAGAAEALQVPLSKVAQGIANLGCVPGRLEAVPHNGGPRVYVDYAHKPGALEHVLKTLRPFTPNRLITVFGCGGDRDRAKRPLMGEIAGRRADLSIVTSDNPRNEDPGVIIAEILPGLRPVAGQEYDLKRISSAWDAPGYAVEPDRRLAIRAAVKAARADDVIVVAGKGHETYQIIGAERIDFDDRKEVARALVELGSK